MDIEEIMIEANMKTYGEIMVLISIWQKETCNLVGLPVGWWVGKVGAPVRITLPIILALEETKAK